MEHSTLLFINNGHSVFFKKKKSIFGCSGSSLLHMGFLKLWRAGAGRDYSLAALASLVAEPQGARASVAAVEGRASPYTGFSCSGARASVAVVEGRVAAL